MYINVVTFLQINSDSTFNTFPKYSRLFKTVKVVITKWTQRRYEFTMYTVVGQPWAISWHGTVLVRNFPHTRQAVMNIDLYKQLGRFDSDMGKSQLTSQRMLAFPTTSSREWCGEQRAALIRKQCLCLPPSLRKGSGGITSCPEP